MTVQSDRARPADILLVAGWSALVAGVAILGGFAVRRFVFQEIVFAPRDAVLLLPLGHLVLFGVLAIPLALVSRWSPTTVPIRAALATFVALGVLSFILSIRVIHPFAAIALSAGAGAQLAHRWGGARWGTVRPRLLRSFLGLLAIPILAGGGWRIARHVRSTRAPAAVHPPGGAPNVLLIVLDTFRADHLGTYGYNRPTSPRLDRLGAEGVVFERALTTSSWSLPAHATMFTGAWPSATSGRWGRRMTDTIPTLAQLMTRAGWRTVGVSGNHVYASWESGLARGFQDYRSYVVTPKQVLLMVPLLQMPVVRRLWRSRSVADLGRALRSADLQIPFEPRRKHRDAPAVTAAFLAWQARNGDRPFFAFLNYFDAHELDALPAASLGSFANGRTQKDRYDAAIAYVDQHLGMLFDSLAARGVLDNTLVIVTADHGEHLGDRGLTGHGISLYRSLLHVPLIMRLPGRIPTGRRIEAVASLRDLAATVLDLAGVDGRVVPGVSLANLWQETGVPTSPAISEVEQTAWPGTLEPASSGPMRSIVWNGWHYIRGGDGREELYAWSEDADETRDLSRSSEHQAVLAEGRRRLDAESGGYR